MISSPARKKEKVQPLCGRDGRGGGRRKGKTRHTKKKERARMGQPFLLFFRKKKKEKKRSAACFRHPSSKDRQSLVGNRGKGEGIKGTSRLAIGMRCERGKKRRKARRSSVDTPGSRSARKERSRSLLRWRKGEKGGNSFSLVRSQRKGGCIRVYISSQGGEKEKRRRKSAVFLSLI